MDLRPYQQKIENAIYKAAMKGHKKILLMAPTGAGKTVIAYSICERVLAKTNTFLMTFHRKNLVEQTKRTFKAFKPSIVMDGYENDGTNCILASIHTLKNREIKKPDLTIIDEVHWGYEANLIQGIFKRFGDKIIIGMSATPFCDKGYILDGFDVLIDEVQTIDLINDKWLVPFHVFTHDIKKMDLSKVPTNKDGEYITEDLNKVVNTKYNNSDFVKAYRKDGQNKQFIGFCAGKDHCVAMLAEFAKNGIKTAVIVADTPQVERDQAYVDFRDGKLQGLLNVDILTTGSDFGNAIVGLDMRPTNSLKTYLQKTGRVCRLNGKDWETSVENGKEYCIWLDCCGTFEKLGSPDERRTFTFKPQFGKVADKQLKIDVNTEERNDTIKSLTEEKKVFLKRVSSVLDLYDNKKYTKEADLQKDVNKFLDKTGWFWWRQNSGVAQYNYALQGEYGKFKKEYGISKAVENFINLISGRGQKPRFVRYTSKSGLADNALYFRYSSLLVWIELKLPKKGKLTKDQKKTFPEMIQKNVLFFLAESVYDVYLVIEHLETHITDNNEALIISKKVYDLPERQKQLRMNFNLPLEAKK